MRCCWPSRSGKRAVNKEERIRPRRPRIHFISLGCPKNLVDSERALARLVARGALICADPADADTIIVSTCGFIEPAKTEAIDVILVASRYRMEGACRKLLVAGCLSQRYAEELPTLLPEVDHIFGVLDERETKRLADYVFKGGADHGPAALVSSSGLHEAPRLLLTPSHYAYLRIAEGCNNRCSYCAVPDIRGPLRSKPSREVVHEATQLAKMGVKELNLVAQDTTAYGSDLPRSPRLAALLKKLCQVKDISWVRLLYAHPAHVTDELVGVIAQEEKICNYVDLPIQHISSRILKKMGRQVSASQVKELIQKMRDAIPELVMRTSIIVGFPGERDKDFQELLEFLKRVRFERLGAFAYSREGGTPAYDFSDQVPEKTKKVRLKAVYQLQKEIVASHQAEMMGKVLPVLLERELDEPARFFARSAAHAPEVDGGIYLTAPGHRPGDFVTARITEVRGYDLGASLAQQPISRG